MAHRRRLCFAAAVAAIPGLAGSHAALAASGTWINTTSTNASWNYSSNWSALPGSTVAITGTNTNTDTATFNSAVGSSGVGSSATPIFIDSSSENIGSILFTGTSVGSFTIGSTAGNSLYLSSGGSISIASSSTATAVETINAPLVIEGASGTYSFTNNDANAGDSLVLGGAISGGNAGNTVVAFNASATPTANYASGIISNGSASTLSLYHESGNWTYAGANTYTGATDVAGGTATFTGANTSTSAITIGLNAIANYAPGGVLDLGGANGAFASASSITVNDGGTLVYDNTAASNAARLGSSQAVTLNAGTFKYTPLAAGNGAGQVGTLNLGAGQTSYLNTTATGSAYTSNLTIESINPAAHATLSASLASANTAYGRVTVTNAPTLANGIIPWGIETTNSAFLTLSGNYLGAYGNINGSYTSGASPSTWASTNNISLTTGTTTANSAALAINSLSMRTTAATTFDLNGATAASPFIINSGGILATGNFATTIQDGNLSAGNAAGGYEFYLWNTGTALESITANIVDNGANSVAVTKAGGGTIQLGGVNTYTGPTTIGGGTLIIAGSTSASSTVSVNTGGTLTVASAGTIGGNVNAGISTATSASNLTNNGIITGTTTVAAGLFSLPVVTGNSDISGNITLAGGSTTGNLVDNGQVTLTGSATLTLGTISSAAVGTFGTGALYDSNSASHTLNFANGTSLFRYDPSGSANATLNTAGTVYLYSYAESDNASPFNVTFNSGTWDIATVGQNNTGAQTGGTTNILNGAQINLNGGSGWTPGNGVTAVGAGSGAGYMHGTWNIGGTSAGTLAVTGSIAEGNGRGTAPTGTAINGLALNVGNSGILTSTAALTLGFNTAQTVVAGTNSLTVSGGNATFATGLVEGSNVANTVLETNATTVSSGNLAVSAGGFTLGPTGTAAADQTNTFTVSGGNASIVGNVTIGTANANTSSIVNAGTLSGGKLLISGILAAGTNTTTQSNSFNWTGGQLSAGTVTLGAGFNGSGSATSTTLTNSAGTLAPGDIGSSGRTYINGAYTQTSGGTLAIDIGGTTASSAYQDAANTGKYDVLTASGVVTLGGTLSLSLINGTGGTTFFPAYSNTFTILSGSSVSGDFSNAGISTGSGTLSLSNGATFLVTYNPTNVVLSDYTAPSLTWTGTPSSTWDNGTSTSWVQSGTATPSTFAAGDSVLFTNAGIANNAVNVNAQVSPASVTFGQTSGNTYTLSGTGGITGSTGLTLAAGTGTLAGGGTTVLQTSNSYTGGTTINAGTLVADNASALGTVASTITLATASATPTLDIQVAPSVAYPTALTGPGTAAIAIDAATASTPTASYTLGTLALPATTLDVTLGGNISGSGSLTVGTTTLSGAATIDTASNTSITLGALAGAFNLTLQDSGTVILNTTSARTTTAGSTTLTGGTLVLGTASALNTSATAPLSISGGATLQLNGTAGTTFAGTATTVAGTATVSDNINSAGAAGTGTLGTLSIGSYQLNATGGSGISSGTAGLAFGATTLTGNPTFNVTNPSGGGSTVLTLGALTFGNTAYNVTFEGSGTTTLGTAASGLPAGTVVNVSGTTLNTTNANSVGTLSTVNVTGNGTFIAGASETLSALTTTDASTGNSVAIGANTLTVGSTDNLASSFAGTISGTGTLTAASTSAMSLGNVSGLARITHSANAGALTLGNVNLASGSVINDQATSGITINQTTGGTIGTIAGNTGSLSVVTLAGTGNTTITNVLASAGQLVDITGGTVTTTAGRHTLSNIEVNGGTLIEGGDRLGMDGTAAGQTLTVAAGTINFISTSVYGARLNGDNGPASTASTGVSVAATQSGGTFAITGTGAAYLQLGNSSGNDTTSYSQSGGTLSANGIQLGADTGGTSTTTFTLSGTATAQINGTISGAQSTGAKQAYVFNGGTLTASGINVTNLTSSAGTAVAAGTTNVLTNNGTTIYPGGLNSSGSAVSGLTTVTGAYKGNNYTSDTLAFNIGGTVPSTSFQDTLTGTGTGKYSVLNITGSATVDGNLLVTIVAGFTPSPSDEYVIVTTGSGSNGVQGTFANLTGSNGVYYGTTTNGYSYEAIFNNAAAGGTNDDITITDVSVPEPTSLGLLGLGGLALMRRRRRTQPAGAMPRA